jgi:hypothetical protein
MTPPLSTLPAQVAMHAGTMSATAVVLLPSPVDRDHDDVAHGAGRWLRVAFNLAYTRLHGRQAPRSKRRRRLAISKPPLGGRAALVPGAGRGLTSPGDRGLTRDSLLRRAHPVWLGFGPAVDRLTGSPLVTSADDRQLRVLALGLSASAPRPARAAGDQRSLASDGRPRRPRSQEPHGLAAPCGTRWWRGHSAPRTGTRSRRPPRR